MLLCCHAVSAQLRVMPDLYDETNLNTLGLTPKAGTETFTVFSLTAETDHYSNGCAIAEYRGRLYGMWQSSHADEDMPSTRQKQCAGNVADSLMFIVGCPVNEKLRQPLVLSLSRDGKAKQAG
ncbi:MAG: hypothetical protein I3J02_01500 [Prevotella sp.]|nr:hypothetical protein [Prevotella sp.]